MLNDRIKENSRCCGAGGGVRSGYREVSKEVSAHRIAVDVPKGAKAIVHTCLFCYFSFLDAVEEGYTIENIDLTELLFMGSWGHGVWSG